MVLQVFVVAPVLAEPVPVFKTIPVLVEPVQEILPVLVILHVLI
jgi:hypothetical protein